jgi:hypothetical protein
VFRYPVVGRIGAVANQMLTFEVPGGHGFVIATTIAPKMAICSQPLSIIETSCRRSRHTAEAASPQ